MISLTLTDFLFILCLRYQTERGDCMAFKIKEVRMSKGMTQEELSEKSGVARMIISGLETGSLTNTTTATIISLSRALGVSTNRLFFDDGV